ncbi:hypothetical protein EVAR_71990_1 [Eumeta japonica]|uniref:Uncharacterized protein n=1 Tax=Eumeta variegata TaxID=151549 RepID=A0A4C1SJJ2_EUMVA|nr:hypothetical protein EVAR_71990_1 [Eumeta japonica]
MEIDNSQEPNIDAVSANTVEDIEVDFAPSNVTPDQSSQDIYEPSENTGSSAMDSSSFQSPVKKSEILKVTNYLINDNLKAYTGVPQEWNMMLEHELLFQESGLLEQLPEACAVMADRGFKTLFHFLTIKILN